MAGPRAAARRVTKTLSAADTWTSPLPTQPGGVYLDVTGTFAGWIAVQRSHDNGATWKHVCFVLSGAAPRHIENVVQGAWYRGGFASTGPGYVSGSATVELAQ